MLALVPGWCFDVVLCSFSAIINIGTVCRCLSGLGYRGYGIAPRAAGHMSVSTGCMGPGPSGGPGG
jgi:hypothetical protein